MTLIVFPSPTLVVFADFFFLVVKVVVNEESAKATQEFLTKRLTAIKSQRSTGELEDLALIIGNSCSTALLHCHANTRI